MEEVTERDRRALAGSRLARAGLFLTTASFRESEGVGDREELVEEIEEELEEEIKEELEEEIEEEPSRMEATP
jgi:hypothetical protein